jgi:hypothetical protein
MSDQDWPPMTVGQTARGTFEEFETAWTRANQPRCPLMPAERHCFHEQLRLWDDPFPPSLVCCWCGCETHDAAAIPSRHGPHAPEE